LNFKSEEIYEHILGFITIYNSTSAGMTQDILNMCQDCGLPLFDSRSIRYDNGSNMWGKHCDIQIQNLTLNQQALFHSFNLTLIECDDQWRSQMLYQSSNIEHLNFFIISISMGHRQNMNSLILKSYF
jgi:hypothetical protein